MQDFVGRIDGDREDKRSNSQKIAELLAKQRAKDKADAAAARTTRDFKEYHNAWQEYYKKYYAHVYNAQIEQQKTAAPDKKGDVAEDALDKQAREMGSLREKIRKATREGARRARRSKHFVPLVLGGLIALALIFIQFNTIMLGWIKAYVMPARPAPGITELDPSLLGVVGPDTRLLIPKINVDVPINLDVDPFNNLAQLQAMENGIFHFAPPGADAMPGEFGNFVVSGHSSNDAFTRGDYKFIFAKLDQLREGDMIYVNYGGVRYTYVVRSYKVVNPNDTGALMLGNERKMLTVITCTPLGTARFRLLVFAEQIAPLDGSEPPAVTEPTPEPTPEEEETEMPGISPTLLERLWNWLLGNG
jgi:sortase A